MRKDLGPQKLSELLLYKKVIKTPAYEWQELALRVIRELGVPAFKKNSVFQACKKNSKALIEKCLNDTKELCPSGEKWKYFFKLVDKKFEK